MPASAARRKPTDAARHGLAPFSLKDVPAFIERQFPVGRLSAEAYKERKAIIGQTLTALGSYWKGRKPLILVRAVVLGDLLPASDDPGKDLDIFLKLMAMDDGAFVTRLPLKDSEVAQMAIAAGAIKERDLPAHFRIRPSFLKSVGRVEPIAEDWPAALESRALVLDTDEASERRLRLAALSTLTYDEKVQRARRPEECDEAELYAPVWPEINAHLGTETNSLAALVEQLGFARFGHRPKVADTFCGGGSIPFEAARLGCDVYASDLNPIACMLTWGAFNIIGASLERRAEIEAAQREVAAAVDAEITQLGIEHDNSSMGLCFGTDRSISLDAIWRALVAATPARRDESAAGYVNTTTYGYDHDNMRVRRTVLGSATTTYVNPYFNYSTAGTSISPSTTTAHILLPDGTPIATVEANGTATTTYWLHLDHLGGIHTVSNASGTPVESVSYYPYGDQRIASSSTPFTEQRKFTGQPQTD